MTEVGNHQQPGRAAWQPGGNVGHELEDRIKPKTLNPGGVEESLAGDARQHLLGHVRGPLVAVTHRILEQPALVIDQAVVDAPGIDADRIEHAARPARRGGGASGAVPQAGKQRGGIPPEMPVEAARSVGKAVHLLQRQRLSIQGADEDAAAAGAQIDGGPEDRGRGQDASK